MTDPDDLILKARPLPGGGGWELLAPAVGLYALAPERGARRGPREPAGALVILERVFRLLLPDGVAGYVATAPPERRHLPVGYGTLLFELRAEAGPADVERPAGGIAEAAGGRAVLAAPQAGRFWRRPEPKSAYYADDGDTVVPGKTLGLLEVMKTFHPVKHSGSEPARVRRFLVADGAEVEEGQAILEWD